MTGAAFEQRERRAGIIVYVNEPDTKCTSRIDTRAGEPGVRRGSRRRLKLHERTRSEVGKLSGV